MNLMTESWIPVIRDDGTRERIAPWQIAERQNPVMQIAAPRPDFQGALYQFLIGLLQTLAPPTDIDERMEYWQRAPDPVVLRMSMEKLSAAFELISSEKEAFMQDYDMPEGEQKEIAALLIDAPGVKTVKDNLDHFVKAGSVAGVCGSCAASALFTLQINAPSGGSGHRVGLRGGGPLTTLLLPEDASLPLWHKLWLNVLTVDEYGVGCSGADASVFPWMAPTKVSDKTGKPVLPGSSNLDHLHVYWAMPRRIRLEPQEQPGACSLCGEEAQQLITHYRTKNYGMNYEGPWVHPLTPYRHDPKHEKPPLSLKGQQGGLGYRHWLGLVWRDTGNADQAARNVQSFQDEKAFSVIDEIDVGLWCFGYDMDKMRARCWYEHQLPVVPVDAEYREVFFSLVSDLIFVARDIVKELRSQVKAAWFDRPKDVKGDMSMVDQSFWQATEPMFYQQLHRLSRLPVNTRTFPPEVASLWVSEMRKHVFDLFDHWTLEGNPEDMDLRRIIKARKFLNINIYKSKSFKSLNNAAKTEEANKEA